MYDLTVIRSRRKTMALQVVSSRQVAVRCPLRTPKAVIDAFVRSNQAWIDAHVLLAAQRETERANAVPFTPAELQALAEQARKELPLLCARFAEILDVHYQRIAIRSQHTRWGSCSGKGNLNFNCLLMLCPAFAREYVVVHELCHLKQMNHSPLFWREVARVLPDYRRRMHWLKTEGRKLMDRVPEK